MKAFELKSWSTAPGFSAPRVTLDPDEPEFVHHRGRTWFVLVEGSVRHRSSDVVVHAPKVLCFDPGEAMDLEIISAIRHWDFTISDD